MQGRRFRGGLVVACTPMGFTVAKRLELECYLYGVVPEEVPHHCDRAALMAQADYYYLVILHHYYQGVQIGGLNR